METYVSFKVPHVLTAGERAANALQLPVAFPSAMSDTNFTVNFAVQYPDRKNGTNVVNLGISNVTTTGCTLLFTVIGVNTQTGDLLTVNVTLGKQFKTVVI